MSRACELSGLSRKSAYDHRREDEEFAADWEDALDVSMDLLEEEARRRALEGVEEPVFYQGESCGLVRKYSDTLLIFLLKGGRPEKFRERHEVKHEAGGSLMATVVKALREQKEREDGPGGD